ncbi:MAG: hypothetical protein RL173_2678 [Fibrobacterota bacterium]|jgi:hypothetical protein
MTFKESGMEKALRALPREEGFDDWGDLQKRLHRRRPFHVRLRKHANTLKWAAACLGILLCVGFWQAMQGRRSVVASRSLELRTWVTAHEQAVESDPYADPWAQTVAEASP